MDLLALLNEKKTINQAALAAPMALGPNDKFTPYKNLLNEENPDVVIWQADAIADDFSKEVIWDQVKQGGAQAVDEGDLSAMKKAALKSELDQAHQEFLANWPGIQKQIVQELVQNAKETAGERSLFLAYSTKAEGGLGEMGPADQAFFLTTALNESKGAFSAVFIPELLDENLQEKVQESAQKQGTLVIRTTTLQELTEMELSKAFDGAADKGTNLLNLEMAAASVSEIDPADLDAALVDLMNRPAADQLHVMLTLTGQLSKDQIETWLILPSALVTLALSANYQTPKIKSTIKELGWN